MSQKILVNGIYKHYKGNIYKIIAIAKHSETLEEMIVYQSIDENKIWVRPKNMWNDIIEGKNVLRFTLIDNSNE